MLAYCLSHLEAVLVVRMLIHTHTHISCGFFDLCLRTNGNTQGVTPVTFSMTAIFISLSCQDVVISVYTCTMVCATNARQLVAHVGSMCSHRASSRFAHSIANLVKTSSYFTLFSNICDFVGSLSLHSSSSL